MMGKAMGLALVLLVTGAPAAVRADPSPPLPIPAAPAPTAEQHYNEGLEHQQRCDWRRAARAFERALRLREAFPEAWNGLGYALRQQKRYAEAIRAYDRALALRPDYVEALEYLGEAYVRMGQLDDARRVLARLSPLDAAEGEKLRVAIERGP